MKIQLSLLYPKPHKLTMTQSGRPGLGPVPTHRHQPPAGRLPPNTILGCPAVVTGTETIRGICLSHGLPFNGKLRRVYAAEATESNICPGWASNVAVKTGRSLWRFRAVPGQKSPLAANVRVVDSTSNRC